MADPKAKRKKNKKASTLASILKKHSPSILEEEAQMALFDDMPVKVVGKKNYVTKEYQQYGLFLARTLDDATNLKMYIRMAKVIPRGVLEKALSFISDAPNVKSKKALFMWKIKELRTSKVKKKSSTAD